MGELRGNALRLLPVCAGPCITPDRRLTTDYAACRSGAPLAPGAWACGPSTGPLCHRVGDDRALGVHCARRSARFDSRLPGSGRLDPAHHRERARHGAPFGVGRPDGLAHRPRGGSLFAPGPVSRPRGPAPSVLACSLGRPLRARAPEPRGPGPGAVGRPALRCMPSRRGTSWMHLVSGWPSSAPCGCLAWARKCRPLGPRPDASPAPARRPG